MRSHVALLIVLASLLAVPLPPVHGATAPPGATLVSACSNQTLSSGTYLLTQDVVADRSPCFFLGSNVVLDGGGHLVTGTPNGTDGVVSGESSNATVRNLRLAGFPGTGLDLSWGWGLEVANVTITDGGTGVSLNSSTDVRLSHVTATGNRVNLWAASLYPSPSILLQHVTLGGASAWDLRVSRTVLLYDGPAPPPGPLVNATNLVLDGSNLTLSVADVALRGVGQPAAAPSGYQPFPPALDASAAGPSPWLNATLAYPTGSGAVLAYQASTLRWWTWNGSAWNPTTGRNVVDPAAGTLSVVTNGTGTLVPLAQADATPPTTSATLAGRRTSTGAYESPATFTLAAADDWSGVATTRYRLDGGPWQSYGGPVAVGGTGNHTVTYRSTDVAGNVEPTKSLSFDVVARPAPVVSPPPPPDPPATTLNVTPAVPDGLAGWWVTPPTVQVVPEYVNEAPWYQLDGGPATRYTHPLNLTPGLHHLAYWSDDPYRPNETHHLASFPVDGTAPAVGAVTLTPATVVLDGTAAVAADVHDGASGVATVVLQVTAPDGTVATVPLANGSAAWSGVVAPAEPGNHSIVLVARDAAGNEATVDAGVLHVACPPGTHVANATCELDPALAPNGTGGGGNGTGGGSVTGSPLGPTAYTGPNGTAGPTRILLAPLRGGASRGGSASGGTVLVTVENAPDPRNLTLVVVDQEGHRHALANGTNQAPWTTGHLPDGYYRVEARRGGAGGGGVVLASVTYLVQNAHTTLLQAAAAVALGLLLTVGLGLMSAGTHAVGRVLNLLGYLRDLILEGLGYEMKDRTGHLDHRWIPWVRDGGAAVLSVSLLAVVTTYQALPTWAFPAFLGSLPILGAAAVLSWLSWFGTEYVLVRLTHGRPTFRLHAAGTLSLLATALLLRTPFGGPGAVESSEWQPPHGSTRERILGLRTLAHLGLIAGFVLVFLAAARWWRYDFGAAGELVIVMALSTNTVPARPFAGLHLWRWSKPLALATIVATTVLYVAFELALVPPTFLAGLGVAGLAFAGWFILAYGQHPWLARLRARVGRT